MPRSIPLPISESSSDLPRVRWNTEQYESLFAMGLLHHDGYELIAGDVVEKMPIKDSHSYIISLLFAFFSRFCVFPLLRSAFTLAIDDNNLPEPDFAVLATDHPARTERGYLRPVDIRLVAEVSDATLARDITAKAVLYARAGIAEYWVIDVAGRRLLIHSDAQPDGYARVMEYTETEIAAPLFAPMESFAVADILPAAP